jgi:predicted RNase H-like HicB family nuclease
MESPKVYEVRAHWDAEARVWWAESDDVQGLVAEAATVELLIQEVRHLVPELLVLNSNLQAAGSIPMRFIADRSEDLRLN